MKNSFALLFIVFNFQLFSQVEKNVNNNYFNFTVEIPEGWSLKNENTRVSTISPNPDLFSITYIEEAKNPLRFYYNLYKGGIYDISEVLNTGKENINGLETLWIEYEMVNSGITFHDFLYMGIADGKLYSIILTSSSERFQEHHQTLRKILLSLKVRKPNIRLH